VNVLAARSHVLFHALVATVLQSDGCARRASSTSLAADDSGSGQVSVRVPAALRIGRALDELSVAIDPASLGLTHVAADEGMVLGVETDVFVFPQGQARPALGRHGFVAGADFVVGTNTWNAKQDGIPVRGVRYVVEMQFVLFETDVPPVHAWDPHAGKYKALWTRTLRQAEE
jgi:hypothetical protein